MPFQRRDALWHSFARLTFCSHRSKADLPFPVEALRLVSPQQAHVYREASSSAALCTNLLLVNELTWNCWLFPGRGRLDLTISDRGDICTFSQQGRCGFEACDCILCNDNSRNAAPYIAAFRLEIKTLHNHSTFRFCSLQRQLHLVLGCI